MALGKKVFVHLALIVIITILIHVLVYSIFKMKLPNTVSFILGIPIYYMAKLLASYLVKGEK